MKRRTVLAQLAVFGVISIFILYYTVFSLLDVRITNRPFPVTVELKTAGGIFRGAEVSYRGVAVGRVTKVDLHTSGVTVRLSLNHGTRVPGNAIAHVYDLSAVGEQYVDLVPTGPSTAFLHKGSVIPASRTTTPLQTATLLYDLERFVNSLNPADVRVLGREGAAAFAGTGPQLSSILDDTGQLIKQLSDTQGATFDLLHNASTLLHGAAAHSTQFDSFASSLDALTATLASSTPTISTLLQQAAPTTQLVGDLIRENGSALGVLLANLATFSDIQVARIPGLRALLVAVPEFGQLAPKVVRDGTLQTIANIDLDQPLCPSGLPLSNPISGTRTSVRAASCNQAILARGAANAPGAGPSHQVTAGPSARPVSSGTAQVGSYDATSGLSSPSDGSLVRLGTNGGQQRLLGNNSWQAMLLAVTGS